MKRIFILAAILAFPFAQISAASLTDAEVKTLKSQATMLLNATKLGEADIIIAKTHASVKKMAGGDEAFAAMTRKAVSQLMAMQVKYNETTIGEPTKTYEAGDEIVCFLPVRMILQFDKTKMLSQGFLVSIRSKSGGDWTFFDSADLREDKTLLAKLLPQLPKRVSLPENSIKEIK